MAGKKCMGTARPGNSSGEPTSRGKVAAIGIMILANERMVNVKLKITSALLLNHFFISQNPVAANRQLSRLILARLPALMSRE